MSARRREAADALCDDCREQALPALSLPHELEHDDGVTITAERGFTVGDAAGVLECFDATAGRVFAALCHLTVGELATAERLLERTYRMLLDVGPHIGHVDAEWIVLTAHRLYLDDIAEHAPGNVDHPGDEWSRSHWGIALDSIGAMSPVDRVAVSLDVIERCAIGEIARCVRMTDFDTTPLVTHSRRDLQRELGDEPITDAFRHAELWLDDDMRTTVRNAIDAAGTSPERDAADARKVRVLKGMAAFATGVLAFAMVRWVSEAPSAEENIPDAFRVTPALAAPGSTPVATEGNGNRVVVTGQHEGGSYTMILPVLGARGESLTYLAPDLTDFAEVVPDTIVRYANGKIGVAWTGPCNRPASTVQLANLTGGVGLRLITGAFPAVACTGMPDRWTTVIEPTIALDDGPIYPLSGPSTLDTSFTGYAQDTRLRAASTIALGNADFGSALVDDANKPWIYGAGCSSQVDRYPSPTGPIFEVRLNILEPGRLTTSDEIVCSRLASRQVLYSDTGAQWPQVDHQRGQTLRNCHGPWKSPTDVPDEPSFTASFYDGEWSTWDGCLVSSRVINSRIAEGSCAGDGVRLIAFNDVLGERIGPQERTLTYLRDAARMVAGTRQPLLHYLTPPFGLVDTGLRFGTDELWLSPTSSDAIYIVQGNDVERWPLTEGTPTCR